MVAERAPKRFGVDPIRDVQVLAPMYRGAVGIDALNERLQERLNPDGKPALGERFRIGDRLIQTRNSHELGLMNGSIVFLRDDDPEEEAIVVDTDEGGSLDIPYGETATLRLAYAISVHKAQGCEVPVVVGVCHRSHARMLTRPLLYTAITRARSTCVLVGDRGGAGDGRAPRRRRRAATPAWPSACAAERRAISERAGEDSGRAAARWLEIGVTLAGIALLAALVLAIPELRHAFERRDPGRHAEVREEIDGLGAAGPLLILGLALIHAVVFYPAEIVDAAAGFAYGFFPALALMMFGWLLSGLLCFAIGRSVARPLLDRWLGAERFERTEAMIERGGVTLLLGRAPDPDPPLQPRLLRRRRRPRPALALHLDDRRRLPADHRPLGLLRHPPRGPQPHRPAGARQRRGAAGPAARRPLGDAPRQRPARSAAEPSADPLHREAEDGRRAIDVAGGVAGLRPARRGADRRSAAPPRPAEAEEAAVDSAGEGRRRPRWSGSGRRARTPALPGADQLRRVLGG